MCRSDIKDFYTIAELAEKIGMSYSWTDKAAREGKIVYVWLGGTRKVPTVEVERIVAEGVR